MKRRKNQDGNFNPRTQRAGSSSHQNHNVLAMRSDNSTKLSSDEPVKHTVVISQTFLKNNTEIDADELSKKFERLTTGVKTHRPATVSKLSTTGTPEKVITSTPSKTELLNSFRFGPLVVFSNKPSSTVTSSIIQLDSSSDFYKSEQYQAIKKALNSVKSQSIDVTSTLLEKSAKERKKNGGR